MFFKSILRSLLSLFIFFFLISTTGFSQHLSYLDSLDGKFALQFQISDNFQLSNFQGTTFSGKYHFSRRDAIRLGLSFDFGDSELETKVTRLDTVDFDKVRRDDNRFGITINTQYIRYLSLANSISFFGGIGPFISVFNTTNETVVNESGTEVKRKTQGDGFSMGLDALIGVEWWFYEYMSLSAEYGLKFSYWSSENKLKDDSIEVEATSKSFNISGNQVNFGITVYF